MNSRNANSKETKYLIEKKGRVINLLSGLAAQNDLGWVTQGTKIGPNFLFSVSKPGIGHSLPLYRECLLAALPVVTLGKLYVSCGCTPSLQHKALCSHSCWRALKHQLLAGKGLGLHPLGSALGTIPWAIDHFKGHSISLSHPSHFPRLGAGACGRDRGAVSADKILRDTGCCSRVRHRAASPAQLTLPAPGLCPEPTAGLQALLKTSVIKWPSAGHLSPNQG